MIQVIQVIREVFRIWDKPAYTRLPPTSVIDALNRVWSFRKVELGLSGGNYLAKYSNIFSIPANRLITLDKSATGSSESFVEAKVERRPKNSTFEYDWEEVPTGSYTEWATYQIQPRPFAAFFGSTDTPQMIVNHNPANFHYRLFYEASGSLDGDGAQSEIDFPDNFRPLLTYDLAIEAGNLIDDQSDAFTVKYNRKMKWLVARQEQSLELFQKWLTTRKPQSVTSRTAFNERNLIAGNIQPNGDNYIVSIL